MKIKHTSFGGLVPKIEPRNLPDKGAQVANNIWLCQQNMQPLRNVSNVASLADSLQTSIYLWRRGGSTEWLSWVNDVNVCRAPIADDQYATIYYTDGTTLHRIRWISGAKVETADVSTSAPGKPTVTVREIVYTPAVQMVRTNGIGGYELASVTNPTSVVVTENVMTVSGPVPSGALTNFGLLVPTHAGTAGNLAVAELNGSVTIYSEGGASSIGTFKVVSISNDGTTITYTCDLGFGRSSTQTMIYTSTNLDIYGQESPAGILSNPVTLSPNQYVNVSMGSGRLYRSATGSSEDGFFFVAEASANYQDYLGDAQLAERMPMIENPPTAMYGLVSVPGGFFAAFNGKDLYLSEPYLPYSWPTKYRLTMDYDIVGLAVSGNDIVVLTDGNPYIVSGSHPDNVSQTKLPVEQACVSKRSIAYANRFVCYASPDGLVSLSGGEVKVITAPFYTRTQWQALTPSSMIGSVHDGRYIGFATTGGIIIDFEEPNQALTTTDVFSQGVYADLENDQLYLIQTNAIVEWRGSASNLTATWRSKEYQSVQDLFPCAVKIIAETYTGIVFRLYADGALIWSTSVTSKSAFRVPKYSRCARWSYEVQTVDTIYDIRIGSSMMELK